MRKILTLPLFLIFLISLASAQMSYLDDFSDLNCNGWYKITGDGGAVCDASNGDMRCSVSCSSGLTMIDTNMIITSLPINITEDWSSSSLYAVIGVRNYTDYNDAWNNAVVFHVPNDAIYITDKDNNFVHTCSGAGINSYSAKISVVYNADLSVDAYFNGVLKCSYQYPLSEFPFNDLKPLYPYTLAHFNSQVDNFFVQFGQPSNVIRQSNPEIFEWTSSAVNDYLGMKVYVNSTSDWLVSNIYFDEEEGSSRVCVGDDTPNMFDSCYPIINNVAVVDPPELFESYKHYQLITDSTGDARVSRFKSVGVSYPANSVETPSPIVWETARVGTYGDYSQMVDSTWAWNIKALDVEEVPSIQPNPIIDDFSTNDCSHWSKTAGSGSMDCSNSDLRCSGDCSSEGLQVRSDYTPITYDVNVSVDYKSQDAYTFIKMASSDDTSYMSVYYLTSGTLTIYDNLGELRSCPITLSGNDNLNAIFRTNGDIYAFVNGNLVCNTTSSTNLASVNRVVFMLRNANDYLDNVHITYNDTIIPTIPIQSRDAKRIYNFDNLDEQDTGTDLIDGNAYGTPPFETGDFGGNIRLTEDINSQGFDIPLGDLTYDETNDFTLQFLYKVNTEGTGVSNLQFAPYYYGGVDLYYIFQYDGSVYKFQVQDTLNYVNIPLPDLGDGQWHLITLEQSATDGKIYAYVDKTKYEASINYAGSPISEKWTFARNYYTGSPFDESFDNIKIFGVALTDQEVNATYDAYFPCTPNWACSGYETCVEPMTEANCNSVLDLNTCGEQYGGNYSEFSPSSCSYPPVITGYVPMHNSTDVPAVAIDSIVEVGIEYVKYAGLIALVGLGVWAMVLI